MDAAPNLWSRDPANRGRGGSSGLRVHGWGAADYRPDRSIEKSRKDTMMNAMPPTDAVPNASYETTRFNALQHGVLSRHAVLPWEDRSEYQALLDALVV